MSSFAVLSMVISDSTPDESPSDKWSNEAGFSINIKITSNQNNQQVANHRSKLELYLN